MTATPPNHPQRLMLADEVHARPSEPVPGPSRAGYVALLVDADARSAEHAHLARLAALHGVAAPAVEDTQWRAELGRLLVRWERHGEFSSLTFLLPGAEEPPGPSSNNTPLWDGLPAGWFERLPGQTIVAVRAAVIGGRTAMPDAGTQNQTLREYFAGHTFVGSRLGNGLGSVYTDFRLRADLSVRMLLVDTGLNPAQIGRMLQRLFEIEAYRMLALLALPIARRQSPRIVAIETALAQLTDGIAREDGREETLLHELTRLAAEIESGLAASRFRFGACRAYSELVRTRIAELREQRIEGLQTIEEFMARRFAPAIATCLNVEQRLQDLSERVAQASSLLATRVGIARERQNQQLLVSMEQRARQQLRLQQTVEGLSIAAILYYLAGLLGYATRGLQSWGLPIDSDRAVALAIVPLAAFLWWGLRRARARMAAAETAGDRVADRAA
jgi:uncharacterized membrane-anchored protein